MLGDTKRYWFGDVIGNTWNAWNGTRAAQEFEAQQAEISREFNAAEAQKARDFEERMSNTAYTRAMRDMKRAGINPATLSGMASSGTAASTPSGEAAASSSHATGKSASPAGIIGACIKALATIAVAAA